MEKRGVEGDSEPRSPLAPSALRAAAAAVHGDSDDTFRGRRTASDPAGGPPARHQRLLELEEVDVDVLLSALESSTSASRENEEPLPLDRRERARALTARRRTKHRQRVREERSQLQQQERALSAKLAALQRSQDSALSSMQWQAAASQQLACRLMAEDRQLLLREAVARHGAAIQRLRATMLAHEHTKRRSPVDQAPNHSEAAKLIVFEGFLQELSSLYAQTDGVLSACGLGYTPTPLSSYYKPCRCQDARHGEFLESKATIMLPFDYSRLSWAVWQCPRRIRRLHDRTARLGGVEDAENTLAASFDLDVYRHEGQNVALAYDGVVRRYVEPSRTVFVWRALTEGEDESADFYIDETGWCVLQPSTEPSCTVIRTYQRYVPTHLRRRGGLSSRTGDQREESMAGGQLTEIMLKAWDDVILDLMRMMEYVILDAVPTAEVGIVDNELQP